MPKQQPQNKLMYLWSNSELYEQVRKDFMETLSKAQRKLIRTAGAFASTKDLEDMVEGHFITNYKQYKSEGWF